MFSGNRLKSLRETKGISQKELAESLNVSDVMVSMYEQDKKKPSLDTIAKMSDYFNVTVDYLLGLEETTEGLSVYLSLARDAQKNGISIEDIKMAIDTIKRLRGDK